MALSSVTRRFSTEADVEQALSVAHGIFRDRSQWLSKPRRIEILQRAAELIIARKVAIATQAASEGGKPLRDSITESSVVSTVSSIASRCCAPKAAT